MKLRPAPQGWAGLMRGARVKAAYSRDKSDGGLPVGMPAPDVPIASTSNTASYPTTDAHDRL